MIGLPAGGHYQGHFYYSAGQKHYRYYGDEYGKVSKLSSEAWNFVHKPLNAAEQKPETLCKPYGVGDEFQPRERE